MPEPISTVGTSRMTGFVRTRRHGTVLVIVADGPPVNALGATMRHGLAAAIRQGIADTAMEAMVIRCEGGTFFAGADISEFGKPVADPSLSALVDVIEASHKPIVAAIHGTALGGGCEVALACHYRVAVPSATLGLPEVKLGLIPGAGGTQRLPRLAGVGVALRMIATGEPIGAGEALEAGLVDRIVGESALATQALAFADEIKSRRPLPRASARSVAPDPDMAARFEQAHARRFRGLDASAAAIACVVKATTLPFAEGIRLERAEFARLMAGPQSIAQRHLFFAERRARRIQDVPADTLTRPIHRIGVIGAGTMGTGISAAFLSAGIPVVLIESDQQALENGTGAIRSILGQRAAKGPTSAEQAEVTTGALTPTSDMSTLAECDLIIEAVYEDMAVKKQVFTRLDVIAKPGAILASNTSFLDMDEIAGVTRRPQDVLGLHFFSPAHVMKLLEVVRADRTTSDVLATAMALARRIGKVAVVAGVAHGFIGNRMLIRRQAEASRLLLEGAAPEQIDRVHVEFGMPMGPFRMADLAGLDIGWHRDPTRIGTIREALLAEGRWGQKRGAGFYDYDERRNGNPSARVAEIIRERREKTGKPQREVTDEEIVERTLYPMINEGALILQEGKAQRASDIDLVWVHGYGWPAYRGGPMFWASTQGYDRIVAGLDRHGFPVAPGLRAGTIV